jgi:hypothetical protein
MSAVAREPDRAPARGRAREDPAPFSIAELMPGTLAYVAVGRVYVAVEVIYVRPRSVGARRVMLRRCDNRAILYDARSVDELLRSKPGPRLAKASKRGRR